MYRKIASFNEMNEVVEDKTILVSAGIERLITNFRGAEKFVLLSETVYL